MPFEGLKHSALMIKLLETLLFYFPYSTIIPTATIKMRTDIALNEGNNVINVQSKSLKGREPQIHQS